MKLMVALTIAVLALSGCKEEKLTVPPSSGGTSAPASPILTENEEIDAGDVEAKVGLELTLETGGTPGILSEELRNAKQRLNSVMLTVIPPRPAELWIKVMLNTTENFATRPVAVRGKVFREIAKNHKEEILSFQTILDGHAAPHQRPADGSGYPIEFRVDALGGLADLPSTMLLSATAQVVMSPAGTDPAMIDPATYTSTPEDTGNLLGNALRINYAGGPSAIPALPAPTPGAPAAPDAALAPPAEAPVTNAAPAETAPVAAPPAEAPAAPASAAATEAIGAAQ